MEPPSRRIIRRSTRMRASSDVSMKVLHVSAYYAPAFVYGGPPRSIHALCRALRRHQVDVQVFTTAANGAGSLPASITERATFEDVPVRYFPRSFPNTPIGSKELTAALRSDVASYDVVHVHGLWNRVVWAAAREARRAGVPYVLSPRGMLEPAALAHRAWRKRAGWVLVDRDVVRGASLLHATSEAERETLVALDAASVALIPNGVEIEQLKRTASATSPLVVFVGRIHPIKRLDLLIDAFVQARQQRRDLQLAIAGPDDSGLQPSLALRAGAHADAVRWVGAVDDAGRQALLSEASMFVACSDSESFGMSVLEAMAAGVPVIVTKTCPWVEVEQHRAGYWVEQSTGAIADAMVRLAGSPEDARAMGESGRALAESSYQWDAIAKAFAAQYQALTKAPAIAGAAVEVAR
jgi:glycosyltransferase involved in cell wall biosynthesis